MPGICGVISRLPGDTRSLADAMVSRQKHYPWQRTHTWVSSDGQAGLGSVTLDARPSGLAERNATALAFDGELYGAREARAHLVRHGVNLTGEEVARARSRAVGPRNPGPQVTVD